MLDETGGEIKIDITISIIYNLLLLCYGIVTSFRHCPQHLRWALANRSIH